MSARGEVHGFTIPNGATITHHTHEAAQALADKTPGAGPVVRYVPELSTLEACALLTFRLHCEMLAGRGDDDAADAIRDALDPLWHALAPDDQKKISWWSERLYNDGLHKIPGTP